MRISEAMTSDVCIVSPDQTIGDAAKQMAGLDIGALPVGKDGRLVGMITDRDIVVRGVAAGRAPSTKVSEIMSNEVLYCYEDEEVEDVAVNMAEAKLRRLPVLDRSKRLVGIVSLGDIALADGPESSGEALCAISAPGGQHSQTADGAARTM
jgi:CBS domain-containing protein